MSNEPSVSQAAGAPKKPAGAPNVLAIILAVAFVFFALIGLLGFNIWRVMFNPTLVKQTLTTEVVSSDLVPTLLQVFSEWRAEQRVQNNESLSGVNEPDIVLLMSYVDSDDWREIKRLLLTEEFVTHLISVSVDGVYSWLDSDELLPAIIWEMTPLKASMTGEQGIDAIMVAYSALPICTDEEIANFQMRLSKVPPGVEVLYNLCQFPPPWYIDQVGDYIDALYGVDENIPVRFNVSNEFGNPQSSSATNLVFLKNQLRLVRFIGHWGWLIALVLLLAIAGMRVRSLRSLGQFIGIPLLVTGGLAMLVAWGGQASIIQFVTKSLLAATSDFVRQEIGNSLHHLTSIFFQPLLIQGAILAGLGIVLIVLIFIKKPKPKSEPVQ